MIYHYKLENGTVRCDESNSFEAREQTIDDFLLGLNIGSNGYHCEFDLYRGVFSIYKYAAVKALGNDEYKIKYYDIFNDAYQINIKNAGGYYTVLKNALDNLDKKCAPFLHDKQVVSRLEIAPNDRKVTADDLNTYIKYLEKYYNSENIRGIIIKTLFLVAPFGLFFGTSGVLNDTGLMQLLAGMIASGSGVYLGLFGFLSKYKTLDPRNHSRIAKYIKQKIAFAKRRLETITKNTTNNEIKNTDNNKSENREYTDGVVENMRISLNNIVKLNREDQIRKLRELKELLVSYKIATKGDMNDTNGLTFDDSLRSSMYNTLSGLNDIDVEVSSIAKTDRKIAECDDLMEHINEYLKVVDSDQKDIESKKPQGITRTLAMK